MQVKVISRQPDLAARKKRVCAYARVSSDSRRQEDSLENQVETYERFIKGNPEYEFAGVYADQGISGYCENRPQFQKMMEKARAGEIDLIITKSISRFARNTVTVLKFARELKELGVGIFFEEQKINTLSGDGEMMLAVLASFAQEESRSMSENNKWSIRKKFERGEVMITTSRFLGYDKNEYGNLIVNRKEAEIVSLVFDLYLMNVGSSRIGELLNYLGVKTVTGTTWESGTINGMLCNEKYKGDFHLQKYYTPENQRNHTRKNRGEVQSYYISENHEPIVPTEVWEQVQKVREQRKRSRNIGQDGTSKFQNRYPLSGMLICPYCGKTLRRRQVYNRKIQWLCSTYIEKGVSSCRGIRIDDAMLKGMDITEQTVIEEVIQNGKKHYSYTSKAEFDRGIRSSTGSAETENGSVLPGINRPRRTVIKL
jgi:DNA invertase Pin-like site-specific DNA recombinase/ssDNA-binding Zn-finger/Zn-ribbon topoisomerase 1